MKYRILQIFLSCFLMATLSMSCVSKKKLTYANIGEIDQSKISNTHSTRIKKEDVLNIVFSANDLEGLKTFGIPSNNEDNQLLKTSSNAPKNLFRVDLNGEILFPILGKVKLEGLTLEEATDLIKNKLSPDIFKDPRVDISIANFKVTLLGEVNMPGVQMIENNKVSILDAIAMAGDLSINADRENIMVIREKGDQKIKYRVNVLSNEMFSSPVFYLEQNDIVMVDPRSAVDANQEFYRWLGVSGALLGILNIFLR